MWTCIAWTCIACGATDSGRREPSVCRCAVEGSWTIASGGASVARAVRADAFRQVDRRRVPSGDAELDCLLGGGWVLGSSALLWGDPGSGKSRLSLRWASRAAPCLYAALEMPAELAIETAASAGAELGGLWVVDTVEGLTAEAARIGARSVVVDSVSATARPLALVRELAEWAPRSGAVVFLIAHRNRRGRALGSSGLEHWPDYTVHLAGRKSSSARVTVRKSRYCRRGFVVLELAPGAKRGPDDGRPARGSSAIRTGDLGASPGG